jgi:hypothetical protein
MVMPYAPALLATPVVNPKVGGFIRPVPYLSVSQYRFAPTAMETDSLEVPPGGSLTTAQAQSVALAGVINRMAGWVDRFLYGAAPAAKGASLCASQSTEDGLYYVLQGQLNLQCEYTPILQLDGVAVGANPSMLQPVAESIAQQSVFGARTIYLPAIFPPYAGSGPTLAINTRGPTGKTYCVWTYTNGYPHLVLAADCAEGDTEIEVLSNGPGGSLLGVYPGTPMSIEDAIAQESINVSSVSGTTISLDSPLQYDHTVPDSPDFIPVTALPGDVIQAAIFLTTALIKTRGDLSLTLAGIEEAKEALPTADAVTQDVAYALNLLEPFRVISKQRS